jgi:hypothetical protein
VSTLAGPAVSVIAALTTTERESLIQRVSKVVEERIWDPAFPRDRWRAAVNEHRDALLNGVEMDEFEQRMDTLVRHAGGLTSVKATIWVSSTRAGARRIPAAWRPTSGTVSQMNVLRR